ncbi:MAG: hypothetical protein ABI054_12465 [Planctomycetota bacterium]
MPKSVTVGEEFNEASRLRVVWIEVAKKLLKDLGVAMTLKLPDDKKLQAEIDKAKKKARLYLTLDGTSKLSLDVRIGPSVVLPIGTVNLAAEKDNSKRRNILTNLSQETTLITKDEVWKWQETHYDDVELSFFRGTISEMESDQTKLKAKKEKLDKLTMAGDTLRGELKDWASKRSQKHYIEFVEDIEGGTVAASKIIDTYVKTGAKLPVNLPAAMKQKLEQTLASGGKPDFAPARALISKMIDEKIIAKFKPEMLAPIKKELDRLSKAIPEKKKAYEKASSGK